MAIHDERMVKDHIDRLGALEREIQTFNVWRAALVIEHETLKAGVSNFRNFQARGNSFFDKFEAVMEADQARKKRNFAIVGILALFLVPFSAWGCTKIVDAVVNIYQIEEQWKLAHPSEFKQKQSMFDSAAPVVARSQPETAGSIGSHHF